MAKKKEEPLLLYYFFYLLYEIILNKILDLVFCIVRNLTSKPRSILSQSNISPIWKRKNSLTTNESSDTFSETSNQSCISPSSTISSDRDNMSLQSTSDSSNSSGNILHTLELHPQPLIIEQQTILQGQERFTMIRTDELYRRRCYRAGLNIFNK